VFRLYTVTENPRRQPEEANFPTHISNIVLRVLTLNSLLMTWLWWNWALRPIWNFWIWLSPSSQIESVRHLW